MKKLMLMVLALMTLVALPLLIACSSETTQTPATTQPPATTEPAQVFNLKYSSSMAGVEPPVIYANRLLDIVEERSNGRVKVERFVGGTLGKSSEQLGLVSGGSVDFVSISASWIRNEMPLHSYMNWALGGEEVVANIQNQMNFVIPETKAVLDKENQANNLNILTFWNTGENGIIAREPFTKLDDLKGKKIGTAPNYRALEALGLTTVSMIIPDIYEGLAKGVIDAQCLAITPMAALKWHEVTKCFMADRHYAAGQFFAINLSTWNSLPADIQAIILDASNETRAWALDYDKQNTKDVLEIFRQAGLVVGELPEEDTKKMHTLEYDFRKQDMIDLAGPKGMTAEVEIIFKHLDKLMLGK
ncbi:TRAP transporter substrate-binding protein [Chloroflexota bacterium]